MVSERGGVGEGDRRADDGMGMTAKQIDRALRRIDAAWSVSDNQSVTKRRRWFKSSVRDQPRHTSQ